MDPHRVVELIENTNDIQGRMRRSLREIDRRALNAMVLVKRHGDALASYGVIASAFREHAAKLQVAAQAATEALQRAVEPLIQSTMRLLQIQQYNSKIQTILRSTEKGMSLGSLPETEHQWEATIMEERKRIQKTLVELLRGLERFQEGIVEQEYIVTNGRIEASLAESSGAPLSRVSREMGGAVAEVREAITQWKRQLEEFAHESGIGF